MPEKINIGEMELFQKVRIREDETLERVPNGWIRDVTKMGILSSVFIPISTQCGLGKYELIEH
jgi:hypothetical protein